MWLWKSLAFDRITQVAIVLQGRQAGKKVLINRTAVTSHDCSNSSEGAGEEEKC